MEQLKILGGEGFGIEVQEWPVYSELELNYVKDVVESKAWWRMTGKHVELFEKEFATYHQTNFALAVSNGTHALELVLLALGLGEGDEVIVPAFTFISTATAVIRCGATPIPVEVLSDTYCIDPASVRRAITPRTKAIIPVHMAGHACEMEELREICREYNLKLVEDAAHGHGGEYEGKKLGSFGDASIFSFQQFKLMSAGEGGIILFQDEQLSDELFRLHNVGRPKNDTKYVHIGLGSNYRMTEFQAAVLRAQLTRLQHQTQIREENAVLLDNLLADIPGIVPQSRSHKVTVVHPHYMYMFRYEPAEFGMMSRELFVKALNAEEIPAFRAYPTIQSTDVFQSFINSGKATAKEFVTPKADDIAENVVWIHHKMLLSPRESVEKMVTVIQAIQQYAKRIGKTPVITK